MELESASNLICKKIEEAYQQNLGFAIGKIGGVEADGLQWFLTKRPGAMYPESIVKKFRGSGLWETSGRTIHQTLDQWCKLFINAVRELDCIAVWQNEKDIIEYIKCSAIQLPLRTLEPYYTPNTQYTKFIEGDITVISPFSETIRTQWKSRESHFPNGGLWNPSTNVNTVQTGFTAFLSGGNSSTRWERSIENSGFQSAIHYMIESACANNSKAVLVGSGVLSLIVVAELKKRGKIAIHTGGSTQLFFGIKGRRWDSHPEISRFFNDSWKRPSRKETPLNAINFVDGPTYW